MKYLEGVEAVYNHKTFSIKNGTIVLKSEFNDEWFPSAANYKPVCDGNHLYSAGILKSLADAYFDKVLDNL